MSEIVFIACAVLCQTVRNLCYAGYAMVAAYLVTVLFGG